jgi:hypothetical protein
MGHWNHRVVKNVFDDGYEQYSIREVFYNDAGEIYAYTENPVDLACETLDGLREYIRWCLKALDNPILEEGKVKFVKDDFSDITEEDLKEAGVTENIEEILRELESGEDKQGG